MTHKKIKILKSCTKVLKQLPHINDIIPETHNINKLPKNIFLKTKQENIELVFDVKGILNRPIVGYLQSPKKLKDKVYVLFSKYVNPSIGQDLIDKNINYVDTAGNIYFNTEQIYIQKTGNRLKKQTAQQKSKLSNPKGLQFLSCILIDPNLINKTIRTISSMTNISTGYISELMRELKESIYLEKENKNQFKLVQKKQLFEKWLNNYGDRLRPSLFIKKYKISEQIKKELEKKLAGQNYDFGYGGEYGAYKLVSYYKPHKIDLFIQEKDQEEITKTLKLLPTNKEADFRVFNLFSDILLFKNTGTQTKIIHPFFIYAELLYKGTDREKETADIIYKKFIQSRLE